MKIMKDKNLLEVVATMERQVKEYAHTVGEEISQDYQDKINAIIQALTPPTADEICKEYKEYLMFNMFYLKESDRKDLRVRYINGAFEYSIYSRDWELLAYANKNKMIITIYPPLSLAHKITQFFMEVK